MELNEQQFIIDLHLRDFQNPASSQHFFVNVVLIDKSNDILPPVLYLLHSDVLGEGNESLELFRPQLVSFQDYGFALIGEVLMVDKVQKLVYLTNQMSLSYRHLIVVSGLSATAQDEDLSEGVKALLEALRVRKNTAEFLTFPELNHLYFNQKKKPASARVNSERDIPNKTIQNILSSKEVEEGKSMDSILGGTDRRLFELQL